MLNGFSSWCQEWQCFHLHPFRMQKTTQAIQSVWSGVKAAIVAFSRLLWPCITGMPFSFGVFSLTEPRFLAIWTWLFWVWFGVFVGCVFPKSECEQDINESKIPCIYIPGEKRNLKSFYSANIRQILQYYFFNVSSVSHYQKQECKHQHGIEFFLQRFYCIRPLEDQMWK